MFLGALMALVVPVSLGLLSRLVSGKPDATTRQLHQNDSKAQPRRINVRYFLAVNAALVFLAVFFIAVPPVINVIKSESREELVRSVIAVVSVALFSGLGLFYGSRKGDLSRVRAYESSKPGEAES
ncbi:MAG: hypothetical protein AAB425_13430 [Bdellovibrionota bacterium]